ncbi:MAG: protein kinase [Deltaproteobacteria bacterium]|nr:protein kinase [Deltaproteobacteria bacterium]
MTTACPTDDVLGAHVQRVLGQAETAQVSSHLDGCAACRQVVIAAVRGGVAAEPSTAIAVGTPPLDAPGAPVQSPALGSRIGRYELRELLGAGGMGRVYAAHDSELDRTIALKIVRPELAGLVRVLAERLVRESRMMAKLAHPSVIAVYDVGRTGDAVFIAMELIRGQTLGTWVRRAKPSWRELVSVLERAGQGLAAAHAAGIIHRDFKPDNVLVEPDPSGIGVRRVVVTDFGVARIVTDAPDAQGFLRGRPGDPQLTSPGTMIGTPAYMAPEQLDGRTIDVRADLFAFAVSAWELLFGQRPFAGRDVEEIRAAMDRPLKLPGSLGAVPARVVRVLAGALALDPADRYRDMRAFLQLLARTRTRRRTAVVGATVVAATALVGFGLVSARVLASPAVDPCERGGAALDHVYGAAAVQAVRTALDADPLARTEVIARLDRVAERWRGIHGETCHAEATPPQAAGIQACLDARLLELDGVIDDLTRDGAPHAALMVRLVGDPAGCATPAPGLVTARIPADPALRRRVTALRHRAFDAEAARDRGDYQAAVAVATAVTAEAKQVWLPLHAETLYLLGTSQSQGGDDVQARATLREAVAVAEREHQDYIAANGWIQLAQSAVFDDPKRALEYATYADAAVERIGRQASVATMLEYVRGIALVESDRGKEGEAALRRGLAMANQGVPELLPQLIQGLGYVLEDQARYGEAVAMYRDALVELGNQPEIAPATEMMVRQRIATCLDMLGSTAEAEVEARRAVTLADRVPDDHNLDHELAHAQLAQVLGHAGKLDEALAEATRVTEHIGKLVGERATRYGEALRLEGTILNQQQKFSAADAKLARACEIMAFEVGEGSSALAECWLTRVDALEGLGQGAAALALLDKLLPILVTTYGETHPQVANGYVTRGALLSELGQHARALPDLERALALFEHEALDPGHLAGAEWALGRALWRSDRPRARRLIEQAVHRFDQASAFWRLTQREATAWLAEHRP